MTEERNSKREGLLSATVEAAVGMLRSHELSEAIPHVLATIGTATGVDRVTLLHMRQDSGGVLRIAQHVDWNAPGIPQAARVHDFVGRDVGGGGFSEWTERNLRGEIIAGSVDEFAPDVRSTLVHDGVKSVIIVPIFAEQEWWGVIGFDSCRTERNWDGGEIEILRMMAEVIGVAAQRSLTLAQLQDAKRIVESTGTILFRLLPTAAAAYELCYISSNISRYGYSAEELIAKRGRWVDVIDPDDIPHVMKAIHAITNNELRETEAEFRFITPDGRRIWFYGRASAALDTWSGLTAIEGIVTDITERKRAALEIEKLANTDIVTGLANRCAFLGRLREACDRTNERDGLMAVHFVDLDGFKNVNDEHGHIIGDELLKAVARRLTNTVRKNDLVARFGGDEFVVLQSNAPSRESAETMGHRICSALGQPYRMHGKSLQVGASVGVECRPIHEANGDAMLACADRALYRAKSDGRNCVRVYEASSDAPAGSAFASNLRSDSAA